MMFSNIYFQLFLTTIGASTNSDKLWTRRIIYKVFISFGVVLAVNAIVGLTCHHASTPLINKIWYAVFVSVVLLSVLHFKMHANTILSLIDQLNGVNCPNVDCVYLTERFIKRSGLIFLIAIFILISIGQTIRITYLSIIDLKSENEQMLNTLATYFICYRDPFFFISSERTRKIIALIINTVQQFIGGLFVNLCIVQKFFFVVLAITVEIHVNLIGKQCEFLTEYIDIGGECLERQDLTHAERRSIILDFEEMVVMRRFVEIVEYQRFLRKYVYSAWFCKDFVFFLLSHEFRLRRFVNEVISLYQWQMTLEYIVCGCNMVFLSFMLITQVGGNKICDKGDGIISLKR